MAYEVRFGWNWAIGLAVLLFGGSAATGVFLLLNQGRTEDVLFILGGVLGLAALGPVIALFGKPLLRVDERGIWLGGVFGAYRKTAVEVPWRDIGAVVVFRNTRGNRFIGMKGRNRPLQLPGGPAVLRRLGQALASEVDPEVVRNCRALLGARLNVADLKNAIHSYAPEVVLVAHT